jgi:uncharacterized protein YoxC
MGEFVHADIFFFITSIAVVIVAAGFCVMLYFLIPLLRDAREVVAKIKAGAKEVEKDFKKIEKAIKS